MGLFSLFNKVLSSSKEEKDQTDNQKALPLVECDATILVVDDSRTQIAAYNKWLTEVGYTTIIAYDGRQGIHQAKEHYPDLIIMDIVMPDVNGYQATRFLKKQTDTQHIPIILISGEEQASGKLWAKKLGAQSFLVKPLKRDYLLGLIQQVLLCEAKDYSAENATS